MNEKFDIQTLFRRTHIKVYNPPYVRSEFEQDDDPAYWRKQAYEAISDGRPGDFVDWITLHYPQWRESDLALHLMGQALKLDDRPYEAKVCLLEALRLRREQDRPLQLASTLLALSEVARYQEENVEAWQYLDEAVKVYPHYRSSHLNRFCLASVTEDLKRLKQIYDEMQQMYPMWYKDHDLLQGLRDDGELHFLRKSELWPEILPWIELSAQTGEQ